MIKKERPKVRRFIERLIEEYPHVSLQELANGRWTDKSGTHMVTGGVMLQARKMLEESGDKWVKVEEAYGR